MKLNEKSWHAIYYRKFYMRSKELPHSLCRYFWNLLFALVISPLWYACSLSLNMWYLGCKLLSKQKYEHKSLNSYYYIDFGFERIMYGLFACVGFFGICLFIYGGVLLFKILVYDFKITNGGGVFSVMIFITFTFIILFTRMIAWVVKLGAKRQKNKINKKAENQSGVSFWKMCREMFNASINKYCPQITWIKESNNESI